MKKYLRCHMVEAQPMTRGAFSKKQGRPLPYDADSKEKGYLVKYPDGYVSWCPKEAFEKQGLALEDGTKITQQDLVEFKSLGCCRVGTKTAPDGKPYTMVEMVYPTGFTAFGTATCVDPKNYSEEIGGEICAKKLDDALWGYLGFMLSWAKDGLSDKALEVARREDAEAAARAPTTKKGGK